MNFRIRRARYATWVCLCTVLGATIGPARAQDLISINGHAITLEQAEAVNPQAADNLQVRQQVVEQLGQQQLLADTIKSVPAAVQTRIGAGQENLRRQALAQLAVDNYLREHPVDDQAVRSAYEKLVAATPAKQYWLRWILVDTPDEAKEIMSSLRNGKADFADIAIARSKAANAGMGGALGWQSDQTLPAGVVGVITKLNAGEVAGPIALDSGYAIIQLVAERDTPKPNFAQVRPSLENQLRDAKIQDWVKSLAKGAKIKNMLTSDPQGEVGASSSR